MSAFARKLQQVGSGSKLANISFRAASSNAGNSSNVYVTIPNVVQLGDALILVVGWSIVSGQVLTAPAGWTVFSTQQNDESQVASQVFYKIVKSEDAGAVVSLSLSAVGNIAAGLSAYGNVDQISPIDVIGSLAEGSTDVASHSTPVVNIVSSVDWLISAVVDKGKTASTTAWSQPSGDILRTAAYNTGSTGVTVGISDTDGIVAVGNEGGKIWTSGNPTSRAIQWSIGLRAGANNSGGSVAPPQSTSDTLFGHWDGERGSANVAAANSVVDTAMANALGVSRPVSNFLRDYEGGNIQPTSWSSSAGVSCTSFHNVLMVNLGVSRDYAGLLAGNYDTAIANYWNGIPSNVTIYAHFQHEPENDGIAASDWLAGIQYYINKVVPIMQTRNLHGGVGACLMGGSLTNGSTLDPTWVWWRGFPASYYPYLVSSTDRYGKFTAADGSTYEDVASIVNTENNLVRADDPRVTRFNIGETGISLAWRNHSSAGNVGNEAGQYSWILDQVPKFRSYGFEAVSYFHTAGGPESSQDQLLDNSDALKAWAQASLRLPLQ